MKAFKASIVTMIFCLGFSQFLVAQKKNFIDYLPETNLEYKMPNGYQTLDSPTQQYVPVDGATSAIFYFIQKKSDILIGFVLIPIFKPISKTDSVFFKPYDPNDSFGNTVKSQSDTLHRPLYRYNLNELGKINAEKAVKYNLKMNRVFMNRYNYCIAVAIHRDNIGDGFIYYFFNDKSKNTVHREIETTKYMLKFSPDSLYKPVLYNFNKN